MIYLILLVLVFVYCVLQGRLYNKRVEALNDRLLDMEDMVELMIKAKTDASVADEQTDCENKEKER